MQVQVPELEQAQVAPLALVLAQTLALLGQDLVEDLVGDLIQVAVRDSVEVVALDSVLGSVVPGAVVLVVYLEPLEEDRQACPPHLEVGCFLSISPLLIAVTCWLKWW